MNFRFLNKKFIFYFLLIFVLLLIIGVFFLVWIGGKNYQGKVIYGRTFVNADTYEVIDTPEGQIVRNQEHGLVFDVPEAWTIRKGLTELDILSPEIEFDEYGGIDSDSIRKGACLMGVEISKCDRKNPGILTDAEQINYFIEQVQENPEQMAEDGYDVIEIDGKLALRWIIRTESNEIAGVIVEVPIENTIYSFHGGSVFSEKCFEEFNEFLKTVSIK